MNEIIHLNKDMLFMITTILQSCFIIILFYYILRLKNNNKIKIDDLMKKNEQFLQLTTEPKIDQNLLEKNNTIDSYLDKKLIKAFDNLIQRKYLFYYKSYNNLSDELLTKAKIDFIELIEASLTPKEKELLEYRFIEFNLFKMYIIEFFMDRITKFQFIMSLDVDLSEDFKDIKLYKKIMNKDSSDIFKILENFK